MAARADRTGRRFGMLTAIEPAGSLKGVGALWRCVCDCGEQVVVQSKGLGTGNNRSCGCRKRGVLGNATRKHGQSRPESEYKSEYWAWKAIKTRCYRKSGPYYYRYGARGIKVCDRWLNDFSAFLTDMGPKPSPEHSVERKDNDGNYEPGNCVWATRDEQMSNWSRNRNVIFRGERMHLSEAIRKSGLGKTTIYRRMKKGMTAEEALHRPARLSH